MQGSPPAGHYAALTNSTPTSVSPLDEIRACSKTTGAEGVLVLPTVTPIERYALWKRADEAPFDPWLRVHWRLGAECLKVAPGAAVITGAVAEQEEWTGMRFPESGEYVVSGALQPITINREQDVGRVTKTRTSGRDTGSRAQRLLGSLL